jgi:cell division protein FtsI/penicillin-binding protein 2
VAGGVGGAQATQLSDYKIIRRNGSVVAFEPSKIAIAVIIENGGFGATYAAPIANLLIERYLNPGKPSSKTAMETRMLTTVLEH